MRVKLKNIFAKPITGEWGNEPTDINFVKIIKTNNIINHNGKIDYNKITLRDIEEKKVKQKQLIFGDILIEKSGGTPQNPVGRVCFFDKNNDTYLTNNFISTLRVIHKDFYHKYVFYNLFYLYKTRIVLNFQNKTTGISNLKLDRYLNTINIDSPPFPQQKAIAQKLDKAQELIELRKSSIKKLDELSKALFVDMFGDPVENEMGWEVVKLSHYGTLARGKSSHRPRNAPQLYNGKYPFIQTGDVSNGNNIYLSKYKQTYSELGIQQSRLFKKGIIAIAIAANIGNAKILNLDCYFPDSLVGFDTECPEFSLFLLEFYEKILDNRATKTAQKNINLKILNDLDVIKINLPLQQKFAKTIEKIEAQKALYEEELKGFENLFASLLSESFA